MKSWIMLFFTMPLLVFGQIEEVGIGDKAPEFTFAYNKQDSAQISDYRGKTVVLVFFATWCSYCVKELPHVEEQIWQAYKDNPDFELLIFGREHTWSELNRFALQKGYTMPFYPDADRSIFSKFARQSIPRTYVINKEGVIASKIVGYSEKMFDQLLGDLRRELVDK